MREWNKVRGALEHSVISAVNVTETLTKLIHKGGEPRRGKVATCARWRGPTAFCSRVVRARPWRVNVVWLP